MGLARSNSYDQLAAIQGNPYRGYKRGGTTWKWWGNIYKLRNLPNPQKLLTLLLTAESHNMQSLQRSACHFFPQRHIHAQYCSHLETGDHICFSLALQIFYCYCSLQICVIEFNVASVILICITAHTNDTWVSTKAEKSEFLLKLLDLNVSRTFFHTSGVPVFIKIYKMLWKFGEHLRTGSWNMHTEELPSWAILAKCLIADPQILKCALYHDKCPLAHGPILN